jgi:hypothetical protein
LRYTAAPSSFIEGSLPKLAAQIEDGILGKLATQRAKLADFYTRGNQHAVLYSRKVGYFLQVLDFQPRVLDGAGQVRPPSEFKQVSFASADHATATLACLNASLFYWFVTIFSDCRHLNKREVDAFPVDLLAMERSGLVSALTPVVAKLMRDLKRNSQNRRMRFGQNTLTVQCIFPTLSKPIIDEIDRVLARHYGFSEEELDFIINYDIKYRMGRDE